MDTVFDNGISHECGYELSGTVGLIAAGEAARDEYHLRIFELFGKHVYRLGNFSSSKVLYNNYLCFCTCTLAESYSQLVPGNTGIRTVGFAILSPEAHFMPPV